MTIHEAMHMLVMRKYPDHRFANDKQAWIDYDNVRSHTYCVLCEQDISSVIKEKVAHAEQHLKEHGLLVYL